MPHLGKLFAEIADSSILRLELGQLTTTYARICNLPQNKQWTQPSDLRIGHLNPEKPNATTLKSLTEKQPAAIGYLLSKRTESIPKALLAESKKLNITLFSIPPDTTSTKLQDAALALSLKSNTLSTSVASYSQLTQHLFESLNSHKAERVLLEKLHTYTNGSFLLLSANEQTLASAGPLRIPKTRLLDLEEGSYQLQIRNTTNTAHLFRIMSEDRSIFSIFVAVVPDQAYFGLLQNAAFMLSLIQTKQLTAIHQKSIQREAFLSEWFANSFDTLSFKHQLNTMGFDESASYTVAVVKLVISQTMVKQEVTTLLEAIQLVAMQFFETISLTALSSIRPKYQMVIDDVGYNPHCIFVFSGANATAQMQPLYQALLSIRLENTDSYELKLGFSQESYDYTSASLKTLYQQAQQAALQAKADPVQFERPEPLKWILAEQSPDKLQTLLDNILKPIQDSDKSGKLFETLIAYLEEPSRLEQLASRLDVHLNTLRYRLKKIETLTGKTLSHPKHLAEFYLVAEILKLNESRAS